MDKQIKPVFIKEDLPYLCERLVEAEKQLKECEVTKRYLWRGAVRNVKKHIQRLKETFNIK